VGAVDVAQAAVVLVGVIERDPRADGLIEGRDLQVRLVLVPRLDRPEPRGLEEDLIAHQVAGMADEIADQCLQAAVKDERAELGVLGECPVDLARIPGRGLPKSVRAPRGTCMVKALCLCWGLSRSPRIEVQGLVAEPTGIRARARDHA
jgi:hypothetical protein